MNLAQDIIRSGGPVSSGSSPKVALVRMRHGHAAEVLANRHLVSSTYLDHRQDGGHPRTARSLPKCSQFFRLRKSFHKRRNWIHIGSEEAQAARAAIV